VLRPILQPIKSFNLCMCTNYGDTTMCIHVCIYIYIYIYKLNIPCNVPCSRLRLKCDGTRAETSLRLSTKGTSPFKSAGASGQSTTGSQDVRISVSNAGYTLFWGSVKRTGYPFHSQVSPFTSPFVRQLVPSLFKWTIHRVSRSNALPCPNLGARWAWVEYLLSYHRNEPLCRSGRVVKKTRPFSP